MDSVIAGERERLEAAELELREVRHRDRLHSVQPDAFAVLSKGDAVRPLFLEWERRAVRPVTMAARLAPYLRYFSTSRPIEDHGALPAVLVVFDDELAQGHFLRIADREMTTRRRARAAHGLAPAPAGARGTARARMVRPRRHRAGARVPFGLNLPGPATRGRPSPGHGGAPCRLG